MMIDLKGSRPEALAKFAEVETAAIPTDPQLKQGPKVLRDGVLHRDQGAKEAIDKLPDRTAKKDPGS